ncbi:MAG: tRNA (adenosine(37)-N6)-dimethylallyltransferase MiaA [Bacteroidales bacterium]|nr:tRNA (adenosine(37)-N6)-dimethylallyltransferase MiaA [Bacteroidales bacterium]MDY6406734.1 tRNA (adenosine(37)-N6)-dimethylallyltransferase MiaA [Bacteroidales bacterium]
MTNIKTLVLILGPTGVGKTELSLRLAERYGCPIVNCDSRQVFRDIPIGTAAPTAEEQQRVKHYFVATRALEEDYNAGQYERDALALLDELFRTHEVVIMTGGSMLYADAVCNGLDDLPSVPAEIRQQVAYPRSLPEGKEENREEWLRWLQAEVQRLDPTYWDIVDQQNPARLMHCIEICLTTGKAYSSLRTNERKERPFRIIKIGLERPREELYDRINRRVKQMMDEGLLEEAKAVYPKRALNSLQTVGYRELFAYFDGEYDLDRAVELIQQNTRHYAKRQLTWFRRDKEIHWLSATDEYEKNVSIIDALLRADSL